MTEQNQFELAAAKLEVLKNGGADDGIILIGFHPPKDEDDKRWGSTEVGEYNISNVQLIMAASVLLDHVETRASEKIVALVKPINGLLNMLACKLYTAKYGVKEGGEK